mgnify:CR=1 FL=1
MRFGTIYLRNADADKDRRHYDSDGTTRLAQARVAELVERRPDVRVTKVRGLAHGELHATEGWIVDL